MTPREKRLLIILGIFAGFGVVLGLYFLVYAPYEANLAQAKDLEAQYSAKNDTLMGLEKKQAKLKGYMALSLPGDADVARREYEALLSSLLRSNGLASFSTVTAKDPGDANRVPLLAPKQPAYNRIGYDIVLRKVDLPTVVKFLKAYYEQPVLQQISRFTIKRTAAEAGDIGGKRSDARADLEVTISTEGVIIDGAEKRQTLYPIPNAYGALGGGLGLGLLQQSAKEVRGILPAAGTELAAGRDYALLRAKDLFHGPLPEIKARVEKPKEPEKEKPVVVAAPPREDISPFIRLTGITWHTNGTVDAQILDMANHHEYEVSRVFTLDGTLATRVKKSFFLGGERKPLDTTDDLEIHEEGTTTDRKFKVIEFTGEGLLLSETPLAVPAKDEKTAEEPVSAEDAKGAVKSSKTGSSKTSTKTSGKPTTKKPATAQAPGALGGPIAFVPVKPAEKRYLWRIGSTLKNLEELSPVVQTPEPPPVKAVEKAPEPPPVKVLEKALEVAPMPRIERIEK